MVRPDRLDPAEGRRLYPALGGLYGRAGKRLFDLALAVPAAVVLAPVLGLLALLVRIRLGRPVFFRDPRHGRHGEPFRLLKFRTMTNAVDAAGELLPDEQRVHPFGDFLRRTSLDELPELLQVVAGRMSLVGPRPLPVRYWERYTDEWLGRHYVRPGITGLTQVSGRNALSWEDKFRHDLEYVESLSLALDLKIIMRTLGKVAARENIAKDGHYACDEFMGAVSPPDQKP